jgi:hypothetical protein
MIFRVEIERKIPQSPPYSKGETGVGIKFTGLDVDDTRAAGGKR